MLNTLKLSLVFSIILLISSCTFEIPVVFTFTEMASLSKGDSPATVSKVLVRKPLIVEKRGNGITVEIYSRPVGNEGVAIEVIDYAVFYYKDKKLVYWGLIDDFMTSKNEKYREVGTIAAQLMIAELEK